VDTHAIDCTYNLIAAVFDSVCPARSRIMRLNLYLSFSTLLTHRLKSNNHVGLIRRIADERRFRAPPAASPRRPLSA
jgi:hypothetical protein